MKWEEFLKPDWRKIKLFIVLIVVIGGAEIFILPLYFFIAPIWILYTVIFLVFLYVFSCLVIWIYDKYKDRYPFIKKL